MNYKMIEQKKTNIQFPKSGHGNITSRISIPLTWLRDYLGVTENDREVYISVTSENEIVIKKVEKESLT